jgi:outer membrane protein OmpA-like peptidoglycan-associated protein
MNSRTPKHLSLALAAALGLSIPAFAQDAATPVDRDTAVQSTESMPETQFEKIPEGSKQKVKGVILETHPDSFTMRSDSGAAFRIMFDGSTKIQEKKGWFGGTHRYAASQMLPGLRVEAEGKADATGAMKADKVQFTEKDLQFARMIDTRVKPVEQNVAKTEERVGQTETRIGTTEENARHMSTQLEELNAVSNAAQGGAMAAQASADTAQKSAESALSEIQSANERFDTFVTDLDQYQVKKSVSVLFKVGSANLTAEAKKALEDIANEAKSERGFAIEVTGYASADGNEDVNKRLSRRRAEAVVEFLADHQVPLRRIVMPYGYGEGMPVADNKTREGRAQNRRVDVKMLVNRALVPGAEDSAASGDTAFGQSVSAE